MYQSEIRHLPGALSAFQLTRYAPLSVAPRARVLYYHGGGLLYGSRNDLPERHIQLLTEAGYEILAFDYPLAPAAALPEILSVVCAQIAWSCSGALPWSDQPLPYVLWGRSAGAYLCLLAAAHGQLDPAPSAVISYYGYGLFCDDWFRAPSPHYRTLPAVDPACLEREDNNGSLERDFQRYICARQQGLWMQLLYDGREKDFFLHYSLRTCAALPCPLFAAHATGDPDVPYREFLALCDRFHPHRVIVSSQTHDFDRLESYPFAGTLGKETLTFLDRILYSNSGKEQVPCSPRFSPPPHMPWSI